MIHTSLHYTLMINSTVTPLPCSSAESVFKPDAIVFSPHGVERGMGGGGRVKEGFVKWYWGGGVCSQI